MIAFLMIDYKYSLFHRYLCQESANSMECKFVNNLFKVQ